MHMDTVWNDCVSLKHAKGWTDKNILKKINSLMQSADIIAGHNVDGFDLKKLNTRFERAGLEPIIGKKTYDTLKIARSKLALEDNSLDGVCNHYGLPLKDDITDSDWLKIATNPDKKTLDKVMKYNIGDVKNGKEALRRMLRISGKPNHYGTVTHKYPDFTPIKAKK